MKKIICIMAIALAMTATFVGCGGAYGDSIEITDQAMLTEMKEIVLTGIEEYFDLTVPEDNYTLQGFETHITQTDNTTQHLNNIFQGALEGKSETNLLTAYGGILSPDNKELYGIILNVYPDTEEPLGLTLEEVEAIGVQFLTDKNLVPTGETVVSIGQNTEASNEYATIVNYDSQTMRFAVGVSPYSGGVTYFEYAPIDILE